MASALPRRISSMYSSMWCGCSFRWSATCCGGNAIGLSLTHDVLGEVVLIDIDCVVLGDLVQDDLRLEGLRGPLLEVGPELVLGLVFTGIGQVLLESETGLGELLGDLLAASLDLGVEQVLGYLDIDLADQGLQYGVAGLTGLLEPGQPGEPVLDVRAQLLDRVELRCLLGELVVGVRQLGACTLVTVTSMSASSSFSGPPTSVEAKVADSPAESPVTASSSPSSIWPEPMVYSTSSAVASASGSPSRLATRLIVTMSPSAAGRSTVSREPKRLRSTSSCWSTSVSGTSSASTWPAGWRSQAGRTRGVRRPRP